MRFTTLCTYVFTFSLFFLVSSCTEEQRKHYEATPTAYGRVDNIMIVAEKHNWETTIGDSVRMYFEALYPVTPQPEPILELRHVKPQEFNGSKTLKTHRAIIVLGVLDEDDPASEMIKKTLGENNITRAQEDPDYRIAIAKDRWAKGQVIVYWFGPNRQELLKSISEDYNKVLKIFHQADEEMLLRQIYAMGEQTEITNMIKKNLGVQLRIPKEYFLGYQDSIAVWARYETDKMSSDIFVTTLPLTPETKLTPEVCHSLRDTLTKKYFSTWIEGSYMQIDDRYLPVYYQYMQINNSQALQARGIWAMVNDFMGGPFVSYMIEDRANQRIIFLDGFVHAPGTPKRPKMRKLDAVFSTFKLSS